jgi:sulfur carrier protein
MKILLNGSWRDTGARDLAAALRDFGYAGAVVATALNGEFVPSESRPVTPLHDSDRLEVLAPMQGG